MSKYKNIKNKSVWDLYVENFRDHLFDLCPSIGFMSEDSSSPEKPAAKKPIPLGPDGKPVKPKDLTLPPFPRKKEKKDEKKT